MQTCSGNITQKEFEENIVNIEKHSKASRLGWKSEIFEDSRGFLHTYLKFNQVWKPQNPWKMDPPHSELADLQMQEAEDEEEASQNMLCSLNSASLTTICTINMEYHVLYSSSYQVPMLFFNAFQQDGKLLSLEQILKAVHSRYQDRLQQDRWSVITQQEHPFLGRPFFHMHPCHTADLMTHALGGQNKSNNYVVTWLSSIGPMVGLSLPLCFAELCGIR